MIKKLRSTSKQGDGILSAPAGFDNPAVRLSAATRQRSGGGEVIGSLVLLHFSVTQFGLDLSDPVLLGLDLVLQTQGNISGPVNSRIFAQFVQVRVMPG